VKRTAGNGRFRFLVKVDLEPAPAEKHRAAERTLARLVALAFAADHPERLPRAGNGVRKENVDVESHRGPS